MLKIATLPRHLPIAEGLLESLEQSSRGAGARPLWELFQAGHMLELSGRAPGKLSAVVRLIARAQAEGEPVAWVVSAREDTGFYPPDFVRAGVELSALVVVRMSCAVEARGSARAEAPNVRSHDSVRAAEVLLRSGAFGLVVIDLTDGIPKGELSWQARLSGLARRHAARVVFLTSSGSDVPSLGPLVSLRIEPSWRESGGKRALLTHQLVKSKLGANVAVSPDTRYLPAGAHA
jgi:recombination protein RecA